MKTTLNGIARTTLLASSVLAHSTPNTYRFKVNGGYSGPLEGQTAVGSFTFDSSIVPTGGGHLAQMGLLTELSFTWDGVAYNALTANTGSMDFSSTGGPESVIFGDDCNAGTCSASYGTADWYIWLQAEQPSNFVYGIPLFGLGVVSLLFLVRPKRMSKSFYSMGRTAGAKRG
jgi:hypothetical protein